MSESNEQKPRRDFLIKSMLGAASAAGAAVLPLQASAQVAAQAGSNAPVTANPVITQAAGYAWLRPAEQTFVEALSNHMCPADSRSPNGVEIGVPIFFDRALAGAWGQGDRLYLQGPFQKGTPNQGYQLGMTPAALFRAGTEGLAGYCQTTYKKSFDALPAETKEEVLKALQAGKISLPNGVPSSIYFAHLLQMFYEGMFADPIYGGNRNKIAWRMIGYPGVNTSNTLNIVRFKNKPYNTDPTSIADLS